MKNILIFILLFSVPMYAREDRHVFSLNITGSLGLIGEYAKKQADYNPTPPPENTGGGKILLPQSMAASGALGFDLAYTWLTEDLIPYGVDVRAGMRCTDMPYFLAGRLFPSSALFGCCRPFRCLFR